MADTALFAKLMDARILFLGPPGSGKGTQCKRLKAELGLPHLSTGDMLRQGISLGKPECLEAKTYIDKGNLVPDEVMISIIRTRLAEPDCRKGFILDGFPRTLPQAESLDALLKQMHLSLSGVFNLLVSDEIIIERTTGRLSCSNAKCGAVYHIKYSPPKQAGICDVCGGVLQQRTDDRLDVVQERLKVYKAQTAPLIDYYKQKGTLIEIDGSETKDVIYADIMQHLESLAGADKK